MDVYHEKKARTPPHTHTHTHTRARARAHTRTHTHHKLFVIKMKNISFVKIVKSL